MLSKRRKADTSAGFDGKIVIVTGGSKGIGLATSVRMFALGANLCIVGRDSNSLAAARAEIERHRVRDSQQLETIACDTSDKERLTPLLHTLAERWGSPDILVNCVGYARPGYVEELDLSDYRRHMEVNYYGQLIPILALLPHMLAAGKGHVVNVSSVLGFMGFMGYAAYCPSKFAITGLTEALRSELSHRGLIFSVVFPPDVDTPGFAEENRSKPPECAEISSRAGLLTAQEAADAIVSGILRGSHEITMGNATVIRRLFRHFPWLIRALLDRDHRKAREVKTVL